jgi:D-alanyl-D-alanine carboxypeptidase
MQASRAVCFVAFLVGVTVAGSVAASTPALVIDVDSGKVLYAERATDPWYPASITKLMTAYVALSAVRAGRISLDTPLTVSENALSMPPSKMGFPPGIEVTLDNALKIIMVKSANDIAVTIAEGVGGSVDGFAEMMNDAAQRLGMGESHFVNPHGLPDERQQTSARDMAILGRALLRDFPEYRHLFQIGAIKFGRRIMKNHNGLIGRYAGADGMKTGFICASGFNVVASATRNGRRLITVVMGSRTATERTIKAAALFDHGFSSFGWAAPTVEQLPASALHSPPNMRPYICERRGPMPAEEDAQASLAPQQQGSGADGALVPPSALAFASADARPKLGPRAYLEPIRVWTGRTPPTTVAAEEEQDSLVVGKAPAAKRASKRAAKQIANKAKPVPLTAAAASVPAAASAFAPAETTGSATKAKAGAIAAQPKAAHAAGVITPPANKAATTVQADKKTAKAAKPAVAKKQVAQPKAKQESKAKPNG